MCAALRVGLFATLLTRAAPGVCAGACYRPRMAQRIITVGGVRATEAGAVEALQLLLRAADRATLSRDAVEPLVRSEVARWGLPSHLLDGLGGELDHARGG